MGSMLRFDSERRELVRERREARLERKRERRQAREHKHAQAPERTVTMSRGHEAAGRRVAERLDRIVESALDHGDSVAAGGERERHAPASGGENVTPMPAMGAADEPVASRGLQPRPARTSAAASTVAAPAARVSRREQDIAAFRSRRQECANAARREARERIRRLGEPAAVADALAACSPALAPWWRREREQVDAALAGGRVGEVGAAARRALWAVSRDAARSSRRSGRDPELALAVCVAYAIIAALPRTALRSQERARPAAASPGRVRRAFWR
jgi:hypothetical protein